MPGNNGQTLQDGGCLMDMLPIFFMSQMGRERGRCPRRSGTQRPVPVLGVVP